ncbi:MAG TPA: coenzyme F420-0:L-glutamate ligase [Candidatus Saccharimonadales bacterium]
MKITAIKTRVVRANECTLEDLLRESLQELEEDSVLTISSKVVALCESRVADTALTTKSELIKQEAEQYTPDGFNKYGFNFTVLSNTFIPSAGIDESNSDGHYVLWPKDPQKTANEIRAFLCRQFGRKNIGVIITDSTSMPPMRSGTVGIMLAHSGFLAVRQLAGTKDLFDRPFEVARSAIGSGLAAAGNVVMGEGAEQTPIAVISDIPFVTFQNRNPTKAELEFCYIQMEDDLYAPFLLSAPWKKGGASD